MRFLDVEAGVADDEEGDDEGDAEVGERAIGKVPRMNRNVRQAGFEDFIAQRGEEPAEQGASNHRALMTSLRDLSDNEEEVAEYVEKNKERWRSARVVQSGC